MTPRDGAKVCPVCGQSVGVSNGTYNVPWDRWGKKKCIGSGQPA